MSAVNICNFFFYFCQVYKIIKGQEPSIPWAHIVWIKWGIPKHSFLAWLFILNRCPTRDRLLGWGLQTSPQCLLCNSAPESRNHIFFSCSFSWDLWTAASQRCGFDPEQNWEMAVDQLQRLRSQSWSGRLILLFWQCCVYWIWQERNARLHRNTFRSVEAIFALLDRQIKDRILSYREVNPRLSSRMMQKWLAWRSFYRSLPKQLWFQRLIIDSWLPFKVTIPLSGLLSGPFGSFKCLIWVSLTDLANQNTLSYGLYVFLFLCI